METEVKDMDLDEELGLETMEKETGVGLERGVETELEMELQKEIKVSWEGEMKNRMNSYVKQRHHGLGNCFLSGEGDGDGNGDGRGWGDGSGFGPGNGSGEWIWKRIWKWIAI